jgi:hypothetical protein
MDNPFKKRATEYFDDPAALLSLVSAEPVHAFFSGQHEQLFDRSVTVVGTPGSGKTTLAQLLELDTLVALAQLARNNDNKNLVTELANFRIIENLVPTILAYRLPSGSTLRDIWQLPYSQATRSTLLKSFIQARAVLGWLRKLEKVRVKPDQIEVKTKEDLETVRGLIKANDAKELRAYAREVEEQIFKVVTALAPPTEDELGKSEIFNTYPAFDAIEAFIIKGIPDVTDDTVRLKPLFILDDAHELHPEQFKDISTWFRNRELKIARWIVTRMDALAPEDFRVAVSNNDKHTAGTTLGRDHIYKLMQRDGRSRRPFRSVARDIARRYIEQMPTLRRQASTLEECLDAREPTLSASDFEKLANRVSTLIEKSGIDAATIKQIEASIPPGIEQSQQQAVLRILVHREMKRSPQPDLFGGTSENSDESEPEDQDEGDDVEEEADAGESRKRTRPAVVTGASLQLFHEFHRPFFFSFDMVADASSENIEQFISLAGSLVDVIETKMMRNHGIRLDAKTQQQALAKRASDTISAWDFPHSESVRKLVAFIAKRSLEKILEPNASLSAGANAFGIPQSEMDRHRKDGGILAHIMHYAQAYNAFSVREEYPCKKKSWCVFELGGLPIIANGLTLARGGFCEGHISDLMECVSDNANL